MNEQSVVEKMNVISEVVKYNQQLISEQEIVQKKKNQDRLVDEYESYIFLGKHNNKSGSSKVEDFIDNYCGSTVSGLKDLCAKLSQKNGRPIHWVDMGGGRGLAMRQIALLDQLQEKTVMTNVDLLKHDIQDISEEDQNYIKNKYPGILNDNVAPQFIQSNMEIVTLPQPADLITSIESIQYLSNPLAALCNWYNQLNNDGIMIIANEHRWSNWIRYEGSYFSSDPSPIEPFVKQMETSKIPFAFSNSSYNHDGWESDGDKDFRNMIIQKRPNTSMFLKAQVKSIWTNPHQYKAVYYEEGGSIIDIKDSTLLSFDRSKYFKHMNAVLRKSNPHK